MRNLLLLGSAGLSACLLPVEGDDDEPADGVRVERPDRLGGGTNPGPGAPPRDPGTPPSNLARFTLDCDLGGMVGVLTMDVEAISVTGITFGPGPNPDITGVIGTGEVSYVTAGELVSSVAHYIFTGRNDFADFTALDTGERFRVQWLANDQGLTMLVNPFGPGPATHDCVTTSARYL